MTSTLLQELHTNEPANLKRAYNFRLVDDLDTQETAREVNADFRNGRLDHRHAELSKLEKGQF